MAELREHAKLTQEEAAFYARIKLATYQTWEQGKSAPNSDDLRKLADAFGQPATAFLEDPGVPLRPIDRTKLKAFVLFVHPAANVDEPLLRKAHKQIEALNSEHTQHSGLNSVTSRTTHRK